MGWSPAVFLFLLGLLCLLGLPGRARAGTVLVLGFLEEGKPNARIRANVVQFLSRMGEEVVGANIPHGEQLCTQTDCLVRLGERYGAQRIVGGELIPNDASYRIQVWLFDRVSELPNSAEAVCTDCSPEMLADTVARTTGHVLEVAPPEQQQAQRSQTAQSPLQPPPQAPQPARCRTPYRSFGRGLALGSLAALTLAGLTTGLVLSGYNGQPYVAGATSGPTWDFAPHERLTFGMTALSAVGLAAAAIPWSQVVGGRSDGVCPTDGRGLLGRRRTFGRGLAIGSLGTLTIAGLASAFALTALNGTVYAQNADGSAVTYDLKAHYTTASITAAGTLLGLGLAIFIP